MASWLWGLISSSVEKPMLLMLLVPLFFLLLLIIFLRLRKGEERGRLVDVRKLRWFMFCSRLLIFSLLLVALASPYTLYERIVGGEPNVVFVVDNSSSFDLFERAKGVALYERVKEEVDADLKLVGDRMSSPLGDALLASLKKGRSIAVVSDGRVTRGSSLGDVALQARQLNTTINIIQLEPIKKDYAVVLDGPSKINSGIETEFTVRVTGTPAREHDIVISIDGVEAFKKRVRDEMSFVKSFTDGYHTLKAELILENDYFQQNNVFYKSVKVISEPEVMLVGGAGSPLSVLLQKAYKTVSVDAINSLEIPYAVIINDLPAVSVEDDVAALEQFVSEGNGLVVFGGLNSFDKGGYKETMLEELLPVKVAGAEKKGGSASIVLDIDISQSFALDITQEGSKRYGEGDIGVSKALAINILDSLKKEDFLGIVAFDTGSYLVSPLEPVFMKDLTLLKNKIASLVPALAGETMPTAGLVDAIELLDQGIGARNIILISDGHIQKKDQFLAAAQLAASKGVTINTVGVGEQTNEVVMQQVAEMSGGSYFKATQKNKVKILLGGEEALQQQGGYAVIVKDKSHFITEHLDIDALVYGFNEVVPKPSAQLLVTTDQGDPLLVVWRYGLGRVVTVLTDDGRLFAGELLNKKNSKLLLRALSWAVGDPERKSASFFTIQDGRVGEEIRVTYRGPELPQGSVSFTKVGDDVYEGTLEAKDAGFHTYWEATYAVNEPKEYESVGFNPELLELAAATGGGVFAQHQTAELVDAVKKQSKDTVLERWHYQWPFVLAALLIFLLEICIRRALFFKG